MEAIFSGAQQSVCGGEFGEGDEFAGGKRQFGLILDGGGDFGQRRAGRHGDIGGGGNGGVEAGFQRPAKGEDGGSGHCGQQRRGEGEDFSESEGHRNGEL